MAATTPRKAAAKKTAPQKVAPSAAARREARSSGAKAKPLEVKWRGETFEITRDHLASAPVYFANIKVQQTKADDYQARSKALSDLIFKIIGTANQDRWISLITDSDIPLAAAGEFLAAVNKASNVPN